MPKPVCRTRREVYRQCDSRNGDSNLLGSAHRLCHMEQHNSVRAGASLQLRRDKVFHACFLLQRQHGLQMRVWLHCRKLPVYGRASADLSSRWRVRGLLRAFFVRGQQVYPPVHNSAVAVAALVIDSAKDVPAIAELGVY